MVAAAIVGSAVVTGVASNAASSRAARSADAATAAQAQSASEAAQLGRDELQFARDQWEETRDIRNQMSERAIATSDANLALMELQTESARDYERYNRETFRPLEQGLVADAQNFDTAGRRADEAGRAAAGVESQIGAAQAEMNREILRRGGSVGGGDSRSVAMMTDMALAKATAKAGASDQAVRNVEQQGWARRMDAASLGRNLPSAQATAASTATQAANSSNANMQSALNGTVQMMQPVQQGYAGARSGALGAGNLYGQAADTYARIMDSHNRTAAAAGQAAGQYAWMAWGPKG